MNKIAFDLGLSFDISDEEKNIAKEASKCFIFVINEIKKSKDQFDIMYNAFQKADAIDPKSLYEKRGVISRFKGQVKKNFDKIKYYAFFAIKNLNQFATDTHISEIISSFEDEISQLDKLHLEFFDILDDLKASDFKDKVISKIDDLKKYFDSLEDLIRERIIEYIDENVLSKSWTSNLSEGLGVSIEEKESLIKQLYNERQQMTQNNKAPQIFNRSQILNPAQTQKIWNPSDMRSVNLNEKS